MSNGQSCVLLQLSVKLLGNKLTKYIIYSVKDIYSHVLIF